MAAGLTPSYNENVATEHLDRTASLVLLTEAIKKLDWEITYVSRNGIIAYTNRGLQ